MIDTNKTNIHGHIVIRDKSTKEILVDKDNAVHFGNFSNAIARAMAGQSTGHIKFMKFGNGGTQIDPTGVISYKQPNVSNFIDSTAGLYNEITELTKNVTSTSDPDNKIETSIAESTNFTDIVILATLSYNSIAGEDESDGSGNVNELYVFDEIALFDSGDTEELMLTHVMFHPVKKSANREIEIEYTLRIQVS
jgi:hypothetical protein